jgi:hypothetical protein
MSPRDGTGRAEGTVIPLSGDRIVLGRRADCDIVIASQFVSRRHAQIVRVGEIDFIEDINSRNGTFLNSQPLTTRSTLKNNDRIRICDFIACYVAETAAHDFEFDLFDEEYEFTEHNQGTVGLLIEPPRLLTEEEWLASAEPGAMLGFFNHGSELALMDRLPPSGANGSETPTFPIGPACQRKFRLFICACARRAQYQFGLPGNQQYLEAAERHTDCEATAQDLDRVHEAVNSDLPERSMLSSLACRASAKIDSGRDAVEAANSILWSLEQELRHLERAALAALCRDIFRPFRPISVDPAWLEWEGGLVSRLARAAYEERCLPEGTLDGVRLAVLADALEEAGCTNGELFEHLRGPGPHVRGCWAVDLLMATSQCR